MGKGSTINPPAISAPKGGGAVKGLGESFRPDLHTGTANFGFPIATPPGRNGLQPNLSLTYSSGFGNGLFGIGWNLSVPSISRKTAKGVPVYVDDADTFLLSGAEDLVPLWEVQTPEGGVRSFFRPRTEGMFARIERVKSLTEDRWVVRMKDGMTHFYGDAGADKAVIHVPDDPSRVFLWKLKKTIDLFGNSVEFDYVGEAGDQAAADGNQLYLHRIRYANFEADGETAFLISVSFDYEKRPDVVSDYRAGFEIRTARRCRAIRMWSHADTVDQLIQEYEFNYLDQQPASGLPPNGASLLTSVRLTGFLDGETQSLPPLEFSYSSFQPEQRDLLEVSGPDLPPALLSDPNCDLIDLHGNGLPDFVEINGHIRYWPNLGDGRFGLARELPYQLGDFRLSDPNVCLMDADGDGRIDLLVSDNGSSGYMPLRVDHTSMDTRFISYQSAPTFDFSDPEVRLVDLNGDGVADAVRTGTSFELFLNDPQVGWTKSYSLNKALSERYPTFSFGDHRVRFGDLSGDGLQDIALLYDGNVEYFPSLGHGRWGGVIQMKNCPTLPEGYQPQRLLLGDVDGDGLADLVYVDDRSITLWVNQAGRAWSSPVRIEGTPPVTDSDSVRLVDLLGTGVAGILWNLASAGKSYFLDFTKGVKPYLLTSFKNNLGATTLAEYAPSTKYFLKHRQKYETRWKTSLPMPVQVLSRLAVVDEISATIATSEYEYHHGSWDGVEKEFRGFACTDQRDTFALEDLRRTAADLLPSTAGEPGETYNPPVETRTWFHVGPVGREFEDWFELDLSGEYWPGDPSILKRDARTEDLLRSLSRRERRDAVRSLRGQVLRTELYALDGSARQERPYSVSESICSISEVSADEYRPVLVHGISARISNEKQRIFFPYVAGQRSTQWERGDEPLTTVSFTGSPDNYGQSHGGISLAVPRGRNYLVNLPPGAQAEPYHASYATIDFLYRDEPDTYFVDRVLSTRGYVVPNDGRMDIGSFRNLIDTGQFDVPDNLTALTVNFFDADRTRPDGGAFVGLPYGMCGEFGCQVRSESLIATEEMLAVAYAPAAADALSNSVVPPYLTPGAPWGQEYPTEYRQLTGDLAGYVFHEGAAGSPFVRGLYKVSEQLRYDFHDNSVEKPRGLVRGRRSTLGATSQIFYDGFQFLPTRVEDAVGLSTLAAYDYRLFQPLEIIDQNGNRASFTYTPLGLLKTSSLQGKGGEGDSAQQPGVTYDYDLLSWMAEEPQEKRPASVTFTRRMHHALEASLTPEESARMLVNKQYSDGAGRVVQSREQAAAAVPGELPTGSSGIDHAGLIVSESNVNSISGGARVLVSGWQRFDNKGRVVEIYEPFFSTGLDFAPGLESDVGRMSRSFYDPRGNLIRSIAPDGSEERIVPGVPVNLNDPDDYSPTPWEKYRYDQGDNGVRTHPLESLPASHYWSTPESIRIDALGRTIESIARNRTSSAPEIQEYRLRYVYDIRGHLSEIYDPLGRRVYRYAYDLAGHKLREEALDHGTMCYAHDASGRLIETRDAKGAMRLVAYDLMDRPVRVWARDHAEGAVALRERIEYGDASSRDQPAAEREAARVVNSLGKPRRHFDEAGLLTIHAYDFKGNVLEKSRRPLSLQTMLDAMAQGNGRSVSIDWTTGDNANPETLAGQFLSSKSYTTTVTYDALNRSRQTTLPEDQSGHRTVFTPSYNAAGNLESLLVDGDVYVNRIYYNSKGQRLLAAYGNNLMTRYGYDPASFRLSRIRSERYQLTGDENAVFIPAMPARPLQDLVCQYDLAGNVVRVIERTPGCGVAGNSTPAPPGDPQLALALIEGDALVRHFELDALYRVISATGRECTSPPGSRAWPDAPTCGFNSAAHGAIDQDNAPQLTSLYREEYEYDPAGNLQRLRHTSNNSTWTRSFGMSGLDPDTWAQSWPGQVSVAEWSAPPSNRLTHFNDDAAQGATHFFDACGNLIRETTTRHFVWDHKDRLVGFRVQAGNAPPSVQARYAYDMLGRRVLKLVRKQNGETHLTIYIDGVVEHRVLTLGGETREQTLVHVIDNANRIATIRGGQPFPGDNSPAIQYYFSDHLGNNTIVTDGQGEWTNREEYSPYGETIFGGFAAKRFRFTGKERDAESGLSYHEARYYAPWLARWTSCDPSGLTAGVNAYAYVKAGVSSMVDTNGLQEYNMNAPPAPQPTVSDDPDNLGQKVIETVGIVVTGQVPRLSGMVQAKLDKGISVHDILRAIIPGHTSYTMRPQLNPALDGHPEWQRFQYEASREAAGGSARFNLVVGAAAAAAGTAAQTLGPSLYAITTVGAPEAGATVLLSSKGATAAATGTALTATPAGQNMLQRFTSGVSGFVNCRFAYMCSNIRFEPYAQKLATEASRQQTLFDANRAANMSSVLSPGQLQFASRGPWAERIVYGSGFEKWLARSPDFMRAVQGQYVGGAYNPDFVGSFGNRVVNIDLTTMKAAEAHLPRLYYTKTGNIFLLYEYTPGF